jgi:hypothetical protein
MQETIKRRINMTMSLTHFQLPPIQDALIIGKRAPEIFRATGQMLLSNRRKILHS